MARYDTCRCGGPKRTECSLCRTCRKGVVRGCTVKGCKERHHARGFCRRHKTNKGLPPQRRVTGIAPGPNNTCGVERCTRKLRAAGYCGSHYNTALAGKTPVYTGRAPKGSGSVGTNGYRRIVRHGHPNASQPSGLIDEHRWIMAESLGRALFEGETVHHKNGVKTDNRLTKGHELHCPNGPPCCNLELWSKGQPAGQRVEDKVKWAVELLTVYHPEMLAS